MIDGEKKLSKIEKGQPPTAQSATHIYEAIRAALAEARTKAVVAVNAAMVSAYWEIGRQIAEAVGERAEYGRSLLAFLSERLTGEFGKGFNERNLRYMRQFYETFPIRNALRSELSWTHYRALMRIDEPNRREFYLDEAIRSGWTARQLERQIHSFFYERLLATKQEYRAEPDITVSTSNRLSFSFPATLSSQGFYIDKGELAYADNRAGFGGGFGADAGHLPLAALAVLRRGRAPACAEP
jgi:hypothetical protein